MQGVASDGVLCTEADLDLGDETTRALELPEATPGVALRDLPGVHDTVIEIEVTANRGDLLSIRGVARDLAAVLGVRARPARPRVRERGAPGAEQVRVRIEAPDLCPRYMARVVRGVRVRPSPLAVRLRLLRSGMRPINAVVDATNLAMLEHGQPLHAFDLSRIADGAIVVRRASAGERIVTLDGVERALVADDLVIADARGPIALAGVMGGQTSEVTSATRDVVLESAFFAPGAVRRTSRRLGLPSQAAYRFERRVDPDGVSVAADAAAGLLARLAGGAVAPGAVEESPGLAALAPHPIRLRPERVQALLGMAIPAPEMRRRLTALGMACRREGGGAGGHAAVLARRPRDRGGSRRGAGAPRRIRPRADHAAAGRGHGCRRGRRSPDRAPRSAVCSPPRDSARWSPSRSPIRRRTGSRAGCSGCAHADRTREPPVVRAERAAPLAARRPGPRAAPEHLAWRRLLRWIRGGQGVRA